MKLTLIKPNIGRKGHSLYVDEGRMEPLQLGVLAGMTPPEVSVTLVDDRSESIDFDAPTDLVALTVETFTARRAYEISEQFRARGVPVVIGGFHPTLAPEEAAEHADAIVTGDAEPVWRTVIEDAASGVLKPRYEGHSREPQAGVFPRRDLFKGKGYLPISLAQFTRGCPSACNYCAISSYFNRTCFSRSVDDVVEEIKRLNRKLVFFVDDNVVANPELAKQLFRKLIPLKIKWVSQGSISMVRDRELMDLMVASGCLGNVIGFESISPEGLRGFDKTANLNASPGYEEEIAILKEYNLQTWAAFLIGGDEDTPDSLHQLGAFAMKHKFTFAAFNVLMPYPNTPLYARLKDEGRLLYDGKWWIHPDYRFNHAAFDPKHMTADELTELAFGLRSKWNSPLSILRRFLDPKTNMRSIEKAMIYWLYNPLFRRETFKKQSMRFGYAK